VIDYLTFSNIGRSFPEFAGFEYNDLDKIDLGLLVDIDVPWMPLNAKLSQSTFWAHIDIDPLKTATPVWTFPANVRVQGKSSRILSQLAVKIQELATPAFTTKAKARSEALASEQTSNARRAEEMAADGGAIGEINPHFFCRILGQLIAPEDLIVNELVTRQSIPNIQIARPIPNTMISNAGGGLGASGGTALGVKLAKPDRCVIQLVGDGSFYFNNPTAVFAVAEQYRLPIFCIVLDNNGWAAVKGATLRVYPQGTAKEIGAYQSIHSPQMDFSKIAEAAGAYGEKLTRPEDVKSAITRCLEQVRAGRSALLHVHVTKH
jgi:acetolactate synthase-1/2/3 large subunit